jgi:hypothetical protein
MDQHIILGVHLTDRVAQATDVQAALTEYGCNIKTRVGLHEVENVCSPAGVILLEMYGDPARSEELADKLNAIEGVEVQKMVFGHP